MDISHINGSTRISRRDYQKIRRKKKRLGIGKLAVPMGRSSTQLKQALQAKIKEGKITMGEDLHVDLTPEAGEMQGNKNDSYGRKIHLKEIRRKELDRQEKVLRIKPAEFYTEVSMQVIEQEYSPICITPEPSWSDEKKRNELKRIHSP